MMLKKLIPAAALLVVMGAAQAQVSLYGLIDASYGKNETIGDTSSNFHSGGDNGSSQGNSTTKVGIKGSQDVGSGYKANFKLETGGITSNGEVNPGGAFFNRQAWVGFSGAFGEVRLGRQDNVPFQTLVGFDLNGASNAASAQMLSLATPWSLNGRQSRSLQYIAPTIGGVTAQFGFQPESADYNAVTAIGNKANYSVGLSYTAGKLALGFASESARMDGGSTFTGVAGSYDFGVAKVEAGYANGGTGFKGTNVGVVVPVAGFNVGLTYAKNSESNGSTATEFFVNREIFKNTYAYFDYGNLDKANAYFLKGNTTAVGVIYVF